jgi:hypothetical protein
MKTVFQVLIIVISKTVGETDYTAHIICYTMAFLLFTTLNFRIIAFNYDYLWIWHMCTLLCILWLEVMIVLDTHTTEHLAYVILLFAGWAMIALITLVVGKKRYPILLHFAKHPHLDKLYAFNFRMWIQRSNAHSSDIFRSEIIYRSS